MKHPIAESLDTGPVHDRTAWTRRRFLARLGVGACGLAWALPGRSEPVLAKQPDSTLLPLALLEQSPFVYISPLLRNGQESRCHAELWYAWIDDSVVVTVAKDRWKATALARGLRDARIWVGDHGRWRRMLGGHNDDFRGAPNFFARAERVADPLMIERLLSVYAKKYPGEIAKWRETMRSGSADGSRILIRYQPNPGANQ